MKLRLTWAASLRCVSRTRPTIDVSSVFQPGCSVWNLTSPLLCGSGTGSFRQPPWLSDDGDRLPGGRAGLSRLPFEAELVSTSFAIP